jgi:hypothetical protein
MSEQTKEHIGTEELINMVNVMAIDILVEINDPLPSQQTANKGK